MNVFDELRGLVVDLPVGKILPGWVEKAGVIRAVDQLEAEHELDLGAHWRGSLRALRRGAGLTLRDLAKVVGADFTHLSKIENGHGRPGRDLVERLDTALGSSGVLTQMFDGLPCPRCGRRP